MSLAAVLVASLLGSLHCAGMCGGFAIVCGGGADRSARSQVAYNGGRLLSYLALGAAAGFLAGRFDAFAEALLGVQRAAMWLLVAALVVLAARELGLFARWSRPADGPIVGIDDPARAPGPLARARRAVTELLQRRGAGPALAVGLLSAVLPCGWLWAFVALAGTTGDALAGALVMGVFWVGTVPALIAVGGLARVVGHRLRRHARRLTAVALLLAAGVAAAGRVPTVEKMSRVQGHAEQVMGDRLAPATAPAPATAVGAEAPHDEPAPRSGANPLEAVPEPGDAPCCH